MEGKKHIHIGKEPNYALYGQLFDLCDAVEKLPIPNTLTIDSFIAPPEGAS